MSARRWRGGAAALTVLAVMAASSACDYATRKKQSALLIDAAKRAEAAETATGTLRMKLDVEEVTPEFQALAQPIALPPIDVRFAFAEREAETGPIATTTAALPRAVFSGPFVYLRRPEIPGASESQFGFREWSRLDFSEVGRRETNDLTQPSVVNPVNPTYLLRLLAGTLSGSVRQLGTAVIDGRTTRHFRMNVDRDKAFRRLGDDDRQAVEKAFSSHNIAGSVYKRAEVWIDEDGRPRRFTLRLRQRLDQDNVFGITYQIDLTRFGAPVEIRRPRAANTAVVDTWNALLSTAVPQ